MRLTEEQLHSYEESGFLFFTECFSQAEIDILMAEIPDLFAQDSPRRILEKSGAVRTVFSSQTSNETFRCFSRLPQLVGPAMQLLGSEVYIHQFKINAKVALEGDKWEWHQDFLYWHKEDGMRMPRVVTAAVFLQEVNEFNGPLLLIPGSHKEGMISVTTHDNSRLMMNQGSELYSKSPPWHSTLTADLKYKINKQLLAKLIAKHSIFSVKGPAGSVLFFHGELLHASGENLFSEDRISVFVTYNSVQNCLPEIANPRPEFIASRDFTPLVTVPDDALLEVGLRRKETAPALG